MAFIAEIKEAAFLDETATADISSIKYCIYDDAADYPVKSFISYDFVEAKVSYQQVDHLPITSTVKTLIDAMIASRAKNTISLPTLVSSLTEKDGLGNVVEYTERY